MTSEHIGVDDLLLAHAAGRLPEAVGLVVATHLALSPHGRAAYREYEALGGAMLDELRPALLSEGSFARLLAKLDDDIEPIRKSVDALDGEGATQVGVKPDSWDAFLPEPLKSYVGGSLSNVAWRHYGAVSEASLPLDESTYRTRLIVLKAGKSVPKHTHDGQEITVVLKGAFNDGIDRYGRGDISIADAHVDHQPVAEAGEDCLCLTVTDAPLRLTGTFSRFLNPFLRF
jgi:putative transcriptional regulator